jgi:hypothetical protein
MPIRKYEEPTLKDVEDFVLKATKSSKDVYVGIDPGTSGAIAFLCGNHHCVIDMPTYELKRVRQVKVKTKKGEPPPEKKTKTVRGVTVKFLLPQICAVFKALRSVRGRVKVCLEIAQPMVAKKMGAANIRTAHQTGIGYGMWPLFLCAKGYHVEEVDPQDWKRDFQLINKDKEDARAKAMQMWPKAPLTRKKDHGRAEALLLAECLRRRRGQEKPAGAG